MLGTIIEIEAVNKIINDFNLPISPKDLKIQLSMCLNENEADLFNAEKFKQITLVNDMIEVYDQTGEFIDLETILNFYKEMD